MENEIDDGSVRVTRGIRSTRAANPSCRDSRDVMIRGLAFLMIAAVLYVTIVTVVIALTAPAPGPSNSPLLTRAGNEAAVAEFGDRLVLVAWWLAVPLLTLAALLIARSYSHKVPTAKVDEGSSVVEGGRRFGSGAGGIVALGAAGIAVSILVASVTWTLDRVQLWNGISQSGLTIGILIAVACGLTWFGPFGARRTISFLVVVVAMTFALPSLAQLPWTLRDPYHYAFVADEMAAVAAGHFPLSDYFPQYSSLLGWPIAPVLSLLGQNAGIGIVLWLVVLQVLALGMAASLPVLLAGPRMLAPAIVVVLGIPLAGLTDAAYSSSSYFPVMPSRIVLPAAAIFAAFLLFRSYARPAANARMPWNPAIFGLGFLCGVTAVNNPDFGVPCCASILVAGVLVSRTWRDAVRFAVLLGAGGLTFVAAYGVLGYASGHPIQWSKTLLFQQIYGSSGFMAVPMDRFGIHIAGTSLFVCAAIAGPLMLIASRKRSSQVLIGEGLLLSLTGLWGLLCLAYFAGRSYPSTMLGGLGFAAGMTAAAWLPSMRRALRPLVQPRARLNANGLIGASLSATLLVTASAFWSLVRAPSFYLKDVGTGISLSAAGPSNPIRDMQVALAEATGEARDILQGERVAQILPMSSVIALDSRLPQSVSVTGHSDPLLYSPVFQEELCSSERLLNDQYVLMLKDVATALAALPKCQSRLNFENAIPVGESTELVRVEDAGRTR